MARYLIGDIHGCADEFTLLLEKINFDKNKDQLYLVGDLVGRGPHPEKVIQIAMDNNAICTMGNYDYTLLSVLRGVRPNLAEHNFASFLALPQEQQDKLVDWLKSRPYMVEDPYFYMVHASLPLWFNKHKLQELSNTIVNTLQNCDQQTWVDFFEKEMYLCSQVATKEGLDNLSKQIEGILAFTITRQLELKTPEQNSIIIGSSLEQADYELSKFSNSLNKKDQPFVDYYKHKEKPIYNYEQGIIPWYSLVDYFIKYQRQEFIPSNPTLANYFTKAFAGYELGAHLNLQQALANLKQVIAQGKLANIINFIPDKPIYFGHWTRLSGEQLPAGYICSDTSCVFNGKLTAYLLPERLIVDEQELLALAQPIASVDKLVKDKHWQ